MTEKTCQNCKKAIGYLEESYSYYGQTICNTCMIMLEKQFGNSGTANSETETETEITITEERIEQEKEVQSQIPKAEERTTVDSEKDTENLEKVTSSIKDGITKAIYKILKNLIPKYGDSIFIFIMVISCLLFFIEPLLGFSLVISLILISWLIYKFCEYLKYKDKLKKITPQIEAINIEELSAKLLSTEESLLELMKQIKQQYGTAEETWENARTYKEKEKLYKTLIEDWNSANIK